MVNAVLNHCVVHIPSSRLHDLVAEIRRHGPDVVFDNRTSRAQMFREQGDEEFAQQEEREAGYILDVYA